MTIKNFFLVAIGGGLGAMLRYAASLLIRTDSHFPLATLLINIVGSFFIGSVMALGVRSSANISEAGKLFWATGICGGFTTFSAFSYENLQLFQLGRYNLAFVYIMLSVLLGLSATWIGFKLFQV